MLRKSVKIVMLLKYVKNLGNTFLDGFSPSSSTVLQAKSSINIFETFFNYEKNYFSKQPSLRKIP